MKKIFHNRESAHHSQDVLNTPLQEPIYFFSPFTFHLSLLKTLLVICLCLNLAGCYSMKTYDGTFYSDGTAIDPSNKKLKKIGTFKKEGMDVGFLLGAATIFSSQSDLINAAFREGGENAVNNMVLKTDLNIPLTAISGVIMVPVWVVLGLFTGYTFYALGTSPLVIPVFKTMTLEGDIVEVTDKEP